MPYDVEATDEFSEWYRSLEETVIEAVNAKMDLLVEVGWLLGRPHADTLYGSRYANLKELRVNAAGRPIRIFYAFDPRQSAIVLIGGDKTGDPNFYRRMVPVAEALYETHLAEIEEERNA
ncbi:MAG: type II toxin-antitoxin system RelE/ParE family toxin [Candidatus Eremiobacteraeota bacterium]|nr:type II toxin-antitoxin system RelE/ParE family toxin [Candidatus Eremiobacteraeota bacterium]